MKSFLPGTRTFPSVQVENFMGCHVGTQARLYEILGEGYGWTSGQLVDASLIIGELVTKKKIG